MKIGLFGDSFTTSHRPANHFAWFNLLAKKLGGEVYNHINYTVGEGYGLGASSTYWSYKRFLQYQHLHDLNIFIASSPYKFPKLLDLYGDGSGKPISGLNSLEWYIHDERVTEEGHILLEQVKNWMLINDEQFMVDMQELMLQHMETITDKPLIMLSTDCNGDSFNSERKQRLNIDFGMWDVAFLAQKSLGCYGSPCTLNERMDMIAAHMPEETNIVFANLLFNYITQGTKIELPEHISHSHPYTEYYLGCE
jgi:hypothetical protein